MWMRISTRSPFRPVYFLPAAIIKLHDHLLIALGGAAGSVARYVVGSAVQRTSDSGFPVGTMFVNVSGCFLIGILRGSS